MRKARSQSQPQPSKNSSASAVAQQLSIYINPATAAARRTTPLRPPASSSTKGRRARGSSCLPASSSSTPVCRPAIHRHDVVAVAVVVASDRARRRGVAVPAPSGGAAHGGAVVAAAPAGAPLRTPRRARAGLPFLLRQLRRADPPHGRRLLPPRAARSAARRPPQGARLLPPLEEALRSNASDLVREDAASDRELAGADPGGAAVAVGAFRPVRGAPTDPPVRGPRPQQHPRRRVGAPPQDPHARLPLRKPQAARALRRRHRAADAGGARAAAVVVGRVRRGGGGRGGVVPAAAEGGHNRRHVRPQQRRGQRRVPAAGRARQLRHRGAQQGLHPGLQVPADEEEQARVAAGQGDQEPPGQARRRSAERRPPRQRPGPRARRRHEGLHELHGPGHDGGRDHRGVQELLLRRAGDAHQPPHLGHRRARHAPGVAGQHSPGGPRRLRAPGRPHQGPPPQAQDARDGRQRDAQALPAGGGHDPEGDAGRGARRLLGAGGHGGHDAHHGRAPRHRRVGRRRHGVQPRALRGRRRRPPAAAADGVHPVRRRCAGVHRPVPGAHGGQDRLGHGAAALPVPAVAGVRARAEGAHDTQPAARRAGHLPPVVTRHAASHLAAPLRNPNRSDSIHSFLPVNYRRPLPIANIASIPYVTGISHIVEKKYRKEKI